MATRIHEIVRARRAVTAGTSVRLAKHFGGDARSLLLRQAKCDMKTLPTLQATERVVSHREHFAA
jgi:plasmid maintenance system antidote protein VapI